MSNDGLQSSNTHNGMTFGTPEDYFWSEFKTVFTGKIRQYDEFMLNVMFV